MSLIKNIKRSYYKSRIIFTFSIITIILVIVLSRVGYLFIKDLYLVQLTEQVNIVTQMIAKQIDRTYLGLLEIGYPTETSENYIRDIFRKNLEPEFHSEIFIFDNNFNIVIHSDSSLITGEEEPRLLLNKKEISELEINSGTASLPFKGDDGKWYLWGFYRLNNNNWLAISESAEHFETLDQLSNLFWLIGFAGVALTIIAGFLMANSITKPLNRLVKFSTEIGRANFNTEIPEQMYGEIKILSEAMNKMMNDLGKNQKERENLLAQIAHEIRNPLGGIELLTNLVKENKDDDERKSEYLDKILEEVQALKILITSYLNYSRPIPSNPDWVDIKKLFPEIKNIFTKEIKGKNVLLNFDIKENKIWFDSSHLKNILINLVANSLDSVSENGSIYVVSEKNLKYWLISVKDNGVGVEQENLGKIFDPFFTTKKNGTGLGLAISKKLCKENKADLIAINNPDKGSTFIIKKEFTNEV
jgi:signal transduction histidine kinase